RSHNPERRACRSGEPDNPAFLKSDLHDWGYGPCRLAHVTGLSRKQISRLLESRGIKREPPDQHRLLLSETLQLRQKGYAVTATGRRLTPKCIGGVGVGDRRDAVHHGRPSLIWAPQKWVMGAIRRASESMNQTPAGPPRRRASRRLLVHVDLIAI